MADAQPSASREIVLDCDQRMFRTPSGEVHLSPSECDVLAVVCGAYPNVISDGTIERAVWGARCTQIDEHLLSVVICKLRGKLAGLGQKLLLVRSRGRGWSATAPVQITDFTDPVLIPRSIAQEIATALGRSGSTRLREVVLAACA